MKIILILLFSLPLLSFEGKKLYQCVSKYRVVEGSPVELSEEEQGKSQFQLVFNKTLSRVKSSDGMVYTAQKSTLKGQVYSAKILVNGRTLYYKLKVANDKGLYKSVSVTGYGELVNDYALCEKVKKEE